MKLHICCLGDLLTPRYKLENDPKCGITTGGQDECYWDCVTTTNPENFDTHSFYFNKVLEDYACLQDCYGDVSMRRNHLIMYDNVLSGHLPGQPYQGHDNHREYITR